MPAILARSSRSGFCGFVPKNELTGKAVAALICKD
jgi:hypothetical protein